MFKRTLIGIMFLIFGWIGIAHGGQCTLAWDANTEPDLAGYKLHYGTASGAYVVTIDVGNVVTFTITGLTEGVTYYFAATAYDTVRNESGYSNEVTYRIPVGSANGSAIAIVSGTTWRIDSDLDGVWDNTPNDSLFSTFTPPSSTGALPVAGDWNGDGTFDIGLFLNGTWWLDYNGNRIWDGNTDDRLYTLGTTGDKPITGNWSGTGGTKIGIVHNYTWQLDYNGNGAWNGSTTDRQYSFGSPGDIPVTGDWNGTGTTEIGVFRGGKEWYLDWNGNGAWNNGTDDRFYADFVSGLTNPLPITIYQSNRQPTQIKFTVTPTFGSGGSISPGEAQNVSSGGGLEFTIRPAAGRSTTNVLVDGISVGAVSTYTFSNITANHTISANFSTITYQITVSAGPGGTITPGTIAVDHGSNQSFSIAPDSGNRIATLSVDGTPVARNTAYTFPYVTAGHTLSATFEPIPPTCTIISSAGSGGTITPNGTRIVASGTDQAYTIDAGAGYEIALVNVDSSDYHNSPNYIFTNVIYDHSISATFSLLTFNIESVSGTGGSINPYGTVTRNYGSSQAYAITPDAGYEIGEILIDGSPVAIDSEYAFSNITSNHTISATFLLSVPRSAIAVVSGTTWRIDSDLDGVWDNTPSDSLFSTFTPPNSTSAKPITGDWNGDGTVDIGLFLGRTWWLDYNGNRVWDGSTIDRQYGFGNSGDIPVTGDWAGIGRTCIGVFRGAGNWYLDWNGSGTWDETTIDKQYVFGTNGDTPVAGDWTGNGRTKIGYFRGFTWYLDWNGNGAWNGSVTDRQFNFGSTGDIPVTGDWNGNGLTKIGVFRGGKDWYLDWNGSGAWNNGTDDRFYADFVSGLTNPKAVVY